MVVEVLFKHGIETSEGHINLYPSNVFYSY